MKIKKIAVFGGVHGNELTGIKLIQIIKQIKTKPKLIKKSSFQSFYLLGNPEAIAAKKRYIDIDLNRCFLREDLDDPNLNKYEQLRAKKIDKFLQKESIDFIIDIHSTTSEMGMTIILNNTDQLLCQLAAYLTYIDPSIKFLYYGHHQYSPYLRCLCPLGLTIEVGGIPHNHLNIEKLEQTKVVLGYILDYIEAYNQSLNLPMVSSINLYQMVRVLDYPRDEQNQIMGKISNNIANYQPINLNNSIFNPSKLDNIDFEPDVTYYPVFIAEDSYIEKGIAMGLAIRKTLSLAKC